MLKKVLMPAMIGAAVAFTGAAFADSVTKKPELYKESQKDPNAKPTPGSVQPGAQQTKKLYKESQQDAGKAVMDRKVNPDAPMNKQIYKESQTGVTNPAAPKKATQ